MITLRWELTRGGRIVLIPDFDRKSLVAEILRAPPGWRWRALPYEGESAITIEVALAAAGLFARQALRRAGYDQARILGIGETIQAVRAAEGTP